MDRSKSFGGYVSVDLGGCDICMSQERLDRSQVRSVLEKVGGEAVSEDVRSYPFDSAFLSIACDQAPYFCPCPGLFRLGR